MPLNPGSPNLTWGPGFPTAGLRGHLPGIKRLAEGGLRAANGGGDRGYLPLAFMHILVAALNTPYPIRGDELGSATPLLALSLLGFVAFSVRYRCQL
jgi:hypothetical protein